VRYFVGPYVLDQSEGQDRWAMPAGCFGNIDLRPPSQKSQANYGLFWGADDTPTPGGCLFLGEGYVTSVALSPALQAAWNALIGSAAQATVMDTLWHLYTIAADPDGIAAVRPLTPTRAGNLEIVMTGHSVVRRKRFTFDIPEAQNVIANIQRDYRDIYNRTDRSENLHRKFLGWLGEKYKIDKPQDFFIPSDLPMVVPARPETTLTDAFTYSDGSLPTVSSSAWSQSNSADLDVVSNECEESATPPTSHSSGKYDTDLSGTDHYAQIDVVSLVAPSAERSWAGAFSRISYDGSNRTQGYSGEITIDSSSTIKYRGEEWAAGSPTTKFDLSGSWTTGDTFKMESDGSTHTMYKNGSAISSGSFTDTTYTSETRCGMGVRTYQGSAGDVTIDNWEAADLAAGGLSIPVAMNSYRQRNQLSIG
jgi:hypothetical protein